MHYNTPPFLFAPPPNINQQIDSSLKTGDKDGDVGAGIDHDSDDMPLIVGAPI